MRPTIEESLTEIAERASFVRGFAALAADSEERPDAAALHGLGAVCADVERLADAIRKALPADALCRSVRS